MKWKQVKLIIHCKRRGRMDFEIVLSREYNSPVDSNGLEIEGACNMRVRYCIVKKGSTKHLKCFKTYKAAKEYLDEIEEASKPKPKK